MTQIAQAWGAIRATLQTSFSFSDIKIIVGLAGLDVTLLGHLVQRPGGAYKGQLISEIDQVLHEYDEDAKKRFVVIVAEEILRRAPNTEDSMVDNLSRLGWTFANNTLIPIEIFDPSELSELPAEAHNDLVMASQRLRDGDLSGAITFACGAVDSTTARIYAEAELGDHTDASFQERCSRALEARGAFPRLADELRELGWEDLDIEQFKNNFKGALNHGANVMQKLRSKMGDVHGTKPVLKPLVFDSLKWAELIVRSLKDI